MTALTLPVPVTEALAAITAWAIKLPSQDQADLQNLLDDLVNGFQSAADAEITTEVSAVKIGPFTVGPTLAKLAVGEANDLFAKVKAEIADWEAQQVAKAALAS